MTPAASNALLQVTGLYKHFPIRRGGSLPWKRTAESRLHAVDGIDFAIGRGETIGLVGESGCGKSTLVRLLTRLLDPTRGSIAFGGSEIGAFPARRFSRAPQRAQIQMVFQDATDSLNPRYTALQAIADPLRRLKGLRGAALRERASEAARLCGLPVELLGRFPHQLSGGQKARVGIARAVALEPLLLILDEPTAALDVSVQVVILHLLEDLKQRLGMSYLFVSHDLNVVRLLCDRVLVMYLGKIVESGPVEAVFDRPRHPYTQALIDSIPSLEHRGHRRLRIAGEPRSPIDPDPNACRFCGRCPRQQADCSETMPVLKSTESERAVACHHPLPDPVAAVPPAEQIWELQAG